MQVDNSKGFLNVIKTSPKHAEIDIYGEIVDDKFDDSQTSAISFRDALNNLGDVKNITLNINSPGGSVFSGIAIYNMIKNHPAHTTVNIMGLAGSIASVIAMAGDEVVMPSNSFLMIHEVFSPFIGNASDMRKFADDLEQINKSVFNSYIAKSPDIDHALLKDLMAKETWLDAYDAKELGLIDTISNASKTAAKISPEMEAQFKNMPNQFKYYNVDPPQPPQEQKQSEPTKQPEQDVDLKVINDKLDDVFTLLKDVAKAVVKEDDTKPQEPKPQETPQNQKFSRFTF